MKKIDIEIENKKESKNYPYGEKFVVIEEDDTWEDLYNMGFLATFVKDSTRDKPIFLMNRSVRIDLEKFELTSENRRILRKTDYLHYQVLIQDVFKYDPLKIGKFS